MRAKEMAAAMTELIGLLSVRHATRLLGVSRAGHYRHARPPMAAPATVEPVLPPMT